MLLQDHFPLVRAPGKPLSDLGATGDKKWTVEQRNANTERILGVGRAMIVEAIKQGSAVEHEGPGHADHPTVVDAVCDACPFLKGMRDQLKGYDYAVKDRGALFDAILLCVPEALEMGEPYGAHKGPEYSLIPKGDRARKWYKKHHGDDKAEATKLHNASSLFFGVKVLSARSEPTPPRSEPARPSAHLSYTRLLAHAPPSEPTRLAHASEAHAPLSPPTPPSPRRL